jgi:hypothetical protein
MKQLATFFQQKPVKRPDCQDFCMPIVDPDTVGFGDLGGWEAFHPRSTKYKHLESDLLLYAVVMMSLLRQSQTGQSPIPFGNDATQGHPILKSIATEQWFPFRWQFLELFQDRPCDQV